MHLLSHARLLLTAGLVLAALGAAAAPGRTELRAGPPAETLNCESGPGQREPGDEILDRRAIRYTPRFARWQRNSPVQVVGTHGPATSVTSAVLLNTSALPVRSVRLGLYLEGVSKGETAARAFAFVETADIPVNIPPGATGLVEGLRWRPLKKEPFTLEARSPRKRFDVVVGVVGAAHGPGRPPYAFNLPQARRFDTIQNAEAGGSYSRALQTAQTREHFRALDRPTGAVIGDPGTEKKRIRCGFVSERTNCSGQDENCTQTACEDEPAACQRAGCIVYQDNEPEEGDDEWCPFSSMPTFCFEIWWF